MAKRRLRSTSPPTLTSREVSVLFLGDITTANLQYLDEQDYLRPSYYYARQASGGVITREQRDASVAQSGRNRGNNRRQFTYGDVVWIQLLVYVKERLEKVGVPLPLKRAGDIVRRLRGSETVSCPEPARLVFLGQDVYLIDEVGVMSLTNGQLVLEQVLTERVEAEVKGRMEALASLEKIRMIPTKCELRRPMRAATAAML